MSSSVFVPVSAEETLRVYEHYLRQNLGPSTERYAAALVEIVGWPPLARLHMFGACACIGDRACAWLIAARATGIAP